MLIASRFRANLALAVTASATAEHGDNPGIDMAAAYMSPEQLRGKGLDQRTDLFSRGLVLYGMATGRPAFSGETAVCCLEPSQDENAVAV